MDRIPVKTQNFTIRQQMLTNNYEIYHYRDSHLSNVALHHHDFYEVYLFLNGNISYTIESRTYRMFPGDLLLISPLELHQLRLLQESQPYERIVLWINKPFLEQFSTERTSLTRCFDSSLENHTNLLRLDPPARQEITELMMQLLEKSDSTGYGEDLLAVSNLIHLVVEINRQAQMVSKHYEVPDKSSPIITAVLNYVNSHYHENLSLDLLSDKFFINKYHLSHEFHRLVGTSLYRYIVQKRLVIAKQMLSDGIPPMDVYLSCGFGDYSNFYRAFRAEYSISPKSYFAYAHKPEE